ncbi:alpha/beta hydrolase [Parasphingopyxis algicola]|uniref:alpha/beta hydrolase n=1 Tax=Parasphingopyxis algicola TaxID=2026624 RepID=UPI0015A1F3D7|nr:alpha/beta hydrolase [Parasphingopyxis algicola]QLC25909.1 alpha/beta hydrolase [Parasphingopyxis algicola]
MLRTALLTAALLAVALGVFLYTADRLILFNRLVPKDAGSERIGQDIAFGDAARQRLDIYAPEERGGDAALPVIVFIHGGGWRAGDKAGYEFAGRALAARGFVTVVPNYRLSPDVHFPAFVEDGAAALRWVRANIAERGGDPDRIVMVGHSAGAHIAAMLAMDERWLGADRAAIAGWVGMAGPYDFLPLDTPSTRGAFGRVPDLAVTQPINYAGEGDPPALLLHGSADDTVKPRQSRRLTARLETAGVPVRHIVYDGIGHIRIMTALSRWTRGSVPSLADIEQFAREVS